MVKVIVGMMGSSVANGASLFSTPAGVQSFLDVLSSHNVKELDTARVYAGGQSEEMLGSVQAHKHFAISTKAPAWAPKSLSRENILSNSAKSIAALKQDKLDIYYLHGPDRTTPLEEQCEAIAQLYKEGKFSRFGVSNLSDEEVQKIHDICSAHSNENWPLPTVYQGGFNPIGRGAEVTLIPLLRKLNMSYYAFSPLGGGLLAKPLDELRNPKKGTRFDEMKVFGDIYLTPEITDALGKVQKVCDEEGIPLMQATLRWFMHHSCLQEQDGIILGASRKEQIESSLLACEMGPLPKNLQDAWEEMFQGMKSRGTLPRYHS